MDTCTRLFGDWDMAATETQVVAVREDNPWGAFQQLFAGVAAGIATTLCTHPLDLIKTRMQSPLPVISWLMGAVDRNASAKIGGIVRIARQVYADEKSLLSFYRGLSPNMVGNAASWGFYFMWYVSQNGQERMS